MARLHLSQPLCRRIRSSIVMGSGASFAYLKTTIMTHGLELPAASSQLPASRLRTPSRPCPLLVTSLRNFALKELVAGSWKLEADTHSIPRNVLYFRRIEGLRGIRHSNRTQSRLTGTGRQPRARRQSRQKVATAARRDLAGRLRPLEA